MNSESLNHPTPDLNVKLNAPVSEPAPSLPKSYKQERLVALPRDPNCIWLYWELGDMHGDADLRLYFADDQRMASQTYCRLENKGHYLHVEASGQVYYAELGTLDRQVWKPLLKSNNIRLPYGYPCDQLATSKAAIRGWAGPGPGALPTSSGIPSLSSRISSRIPSLSSAIFSRRSSTLNYVKNK